MLVDRVHLPLPWLAVEGMPSGCAVAGCDRADLEPFPARRPIFHLEPDGLDARFRAPPLTARSAPPTGPAPAAERNHGHVRVAARFCSPPPPTAPSAYEHRPRFSPERYAPLPGTVVPRYLRRLTGEVLRARLPRGVSWATFARRGLVDAGRRRRGDPALGGA